MTKLARSVVWTGCLTTLLSLVATQPVAARTWTDTQGRKVEAEFAGVKNGMVQLKTESGKVQAVPVEQLSSEDRRFVAAEMGIKPAAPAEGQAQPAAPPATPAAADDNDRFSEAIRQNPNSADAYYQRGLARLNRGDAKDALADFNQAVKLDPKLAEAYDGRGQAHSAVGDSVSAAKDFDKAIELKPELASAYQHRGDNLKELGKSPAGKELVDEKIEAYRRNYQAARDKQLTDKAWQPLNNTSGPTSRAGMIGQMARVDYEKAKQLEAAYGAGKGSGGGSGSGYGSGTGKGSGPGKKPEMASAPPKESKPPMKEESPPETPEPAPAGVVVIPEKVAQGENVVLVADPDKLAAGLPSEASAESPGKKSPAPATGESKSEEPNSAAAKKDESKPAAPVAVDFYRDKDGDGKLDTKKDELLASDKDPADGYSAEVSTANFPVGKQKYFAAPKMAAAEKSPGMGKEATPSKGKSAADAKAAADGTAPPSDGSATEGSELASNAPSPDGEKSAASPKEGEEFQPAEPQTLASAAVSGTGEVVSPEEMAAVDEKSPPKKTAKAGKGKGSGKGGGDYAGPRNSKAARAVERALGYAGREEYGPAINEYNDLLTEYVDDPYYLAGRAGVHLAQGGYDLAIRDYNRVIEVETPTAEIYYNRGCAYLSVGNLPAAVADFSESLRLDELGKFSNLALNNRGTAYARQGRLDLALADFEAAVKRNPNDALAYRNRSLALRKLGRVTEADADLAKAAQLGAGA